MYVNHINYQLYFLSIFWKLAHVIRVCHPYHLWNGVLKLLAGS